MFTKAAIISAALLVAQEAQARPYTAPPAPSPTCTSGAGNIGGAKPASLSTYDSFSTAKFIPYSNAAKVKDWTDPPAIKISVNGKPLTATVDTGSTGIVLPREFAPKDYETSCKIGQIFYTSSHWLQQGYWCDLDVGLGENVVARATTLVKFSEVCCPTFDPKIHGSRCPKENIELGCVCKKNCPDPKAKRGEELSEEDLEAVAEQAEGVEKRQAALKAYMGVGFGRGGETAKNLFFNVKSVDGKAVDDKYRQGYVIQTDGVWLGLTEENTKNYSPIKLSLRKTPHDQRDWEEPPAAVQIADSEWLMGTILADTGIPQAYVRGSVSRKEGDKINVRVGPSIDNPVASFDFVSVPEAKKGSITGNPVQPTWVGTRSVNGLICGRKFYNSFDLFVDGDGGYYGLRKKD